MVFAALFGACTKEKTDYEAELAEEVTEYVEFEEVTVFTAGNYRVHLEALNGTLYQGYNAIRVKIDPLQSGADTALSVSFLPLLSTAGLATDSSCPHRNTLIRHASAGYYEGYVVFTEASDATKTWQLQLGVASGNQRVFAEQPIVVQSQPNKNLNMTSFVGKDGTRYIIALVSPQKPQVAENKLLAGIYRRNNGSEQTERILDKNGADVTHLTYREVNAYTLRLDPRMPEPSMGNHSSPNNQDLTQSSNGFYQGVVNYTMTGNWTLNFILLNQQGQMVKGTIVPDDFTPGVQGVKSELFIDILF